MKRKSRRSKSRVRRGNARGKAGAPSPDKSPCWGWLLITEMQTGTWSHRLSEGTFTIGRSPEVDIRIRHPTVSRHHAKICITESKGALQDLGSQNGTRLNGDAVRQADLKIGDMIQFGAISATLVSEFDDGLSVALKLDTDTAKIDPGNRNQIAGLTPAQRRVLPWLLQGISERQIGIELHLSEHTVHSHVKAIYRIFDVGSRATLVAKIWGAWQEN